MSSFHIKDIDKLSESDLRLMNNSWEEFEGKVDSQSLESVILLKSLVKVAFVQGYASGKVDRIPIAEGNLIPYDQED
tara:strand:+ start:942 stop:1172 length:231 start_codon:yes stop_codon:yes gene_type:complete